MTNLFRKEAVVHANRRLTGEIVLAAPLPLRFLAGLACLATVLAFTFACSASYARRQTVEGWLIPEGGLIRITAHDAGVVEWLGVQEGDEVGSGEPMFRIKASSQTPDGDTASRSLASLAAEDQASSAQNRAQLLKLGVQQQELRARRTGLVASIGEAERGVSAIEQRERLAQKKVARAETLVSQGYLADAAVDDLRASAMGVVQELSAARSSVLELKRQLVDIDHELAALAQDVASGRAAGVQSAATFEQRRVAAQAQSMSIATAPMRGRVVALPAALGQSVAANSVLAILTPDHSALVAELYVPSRAVGFVREGQQVRLMYEAFPYQTFGAGTGRVQSVSRTVLTADELGAPGLAIKEPVFRVRVTVPKQSVKAYGKDIPLQPGMLLKADVVTDRRTLIQWILDPVYAAGRRA